MTQRNTQSLPSALDHLDDIVERMRNARIALFLDYDGTLTPIVARPELATLDASMRQTVRDLSVRCAVAVISGRALAEVRRLVAIDKVSYAGSHGFNIVGPLGSSISHQAGQDYLGAIDEAERQLHRRLGRIPGALVDRKETSVAVHYRLVAPDQRQQVDDVVDKVLATQTRLRKGHGKQVYELRPDMDWHKGKAVLWLLAAWGLDGADALPIYIGDDATDEDAFASLPEHGIGIVVCQESRPTAARYTLRDPEEVGRFLRALCAALHRRTD